MKKQYYHPNSAVNCIRNPQFRIGAPVTTYLPIIRLINQRGDITQGGFHHRNETSWELVDATAPVVVDGFKVFLKFTIAHLVEKSENEREHSSIIGQRLGNPTGLSAG